MFGSRKPGRTGLPILTAMIAVLSLPLSGAAQMKVKTTSQEDVFFIPGLGAVVAPEDGRLKVVHVPDQRSKEFENVDIITGDYLLMANGKRLKTIDEIRAIFDSVPVGDTIEFGIKRDQDMLIAGVKRVSDESPGGKVMVMTRTVTGDNAQTAGGEFNFQGGEGMAVLVIPELGVIVGKEGEYLKVIGSMPGPKEGLTGEPPKEGDRVISIQGKETSQIDQFQASFDRINPGEIVAIQYIRGSDTMTVKFERAEIQHEMMMKSE